MSQLSSTMHASSPTGPTSEEERLMKMYGRLPTRADLLNKKLKDRKYFDSGDYALSQAGKTSAGVGSEHPFNEEQQAPPAPPHVQGSPEQQQDSPASLNKSPISTPHRGSFSSQTSQSPPLSAGACSPPKVVGDPQAYTEHTTTTKTPGTVPILSPVRDRSSSLSPPDADIANEAVNNYNQKLQAAQRMH